MSCKLKLDDRIIIDVDVAIKEEPSEEENLHFDENSTFVSEVKDAPSFEEEKFEIPSCDDETKEKEEIIGEGFIKTEGCETTSVEVRNFCSL